MRQLSGDSSAGPVIAIVGGGASGTLTAAHLLRHAAWQRVPLHVALIDRDGRHGLGLAYSTTNAAHLLNTMASQTSAFPDEPDHLIRWSGAEPQAFLPRLTYGQYLRDTLAQAERLALPHARLTRLTTQVVAIRQPAGGQRDRAVRLITADGPVDADIAVLAVGNTTAGFPFQTPVSDRIVADPWRAGALERVSEGGPVVVVGTGLTMIDLALAICGQGPGQAVCAVSRHGLLPREHPGTAPGDQGVWLPAAHTAPEPVRLTELLSQVRAAIAVDPARWHDVVSAMRPYLPDLWYRLAAGDKKLFLAHLARYWEVHRHLMPPPTAQRIAALRGSGQLTVLPGRITGVREQGDQLRVSVQRPDGGSELAASWLVNAAGASADIGATSDPLLSGLFAAGLARPDPLRLGLDATTYGALIDACGAPSETLYTLGPPLRGLWYETTSMPEIRVQAAALARRIAAGRSVSRPGGRAA